MFAPDLRSFSIAPFPGYAPLESQIRTVRSFRRPVILVDDLLHSGNRLNALEPAYISAMPLTLEEIFISEMGERGYDYSSLI